MFEIKNVSYSIGEKKLIDQFSLNLDSGELLVVLGPNGAGKSTLIKLMSGEYKPDSGQVRLDEKLLHSISLKQRARIRAVLPQSSSLNFPFKVSEVVKMGRSPHAGAGLSVDQDIVSKALEMADAHHLKDRIFTTLSGGERQRVHLARVLAQIWPEHNDGSPRYLLLDEPTSALDLAHQHKTLMTAKKITKSFGIGVLAVLHDLNLAAYYADRLAILQDGKLLCQGKPETVLTQDNIYQAFGIPVKVIDHPIHHNCPLVVTPAQMAAVQISTC